MAFFLKLLISAIFSAYDHYEIRSLELFMGLQNNIKCFFGLPIGMITINTDGLIARRRNPHMDMLGWITFKAVMAIFVRVERCA